MSVKWSEHVYYDETSPSGLRWARKAGNGKIDTHSVVGTLTKLDYWRVNINYRNYFNHQIIYELLNNCCIIKPYQIDHIDGDKSNQNINNLRVVSNRQNSINQKFRKTNTSGVKGVWFDKKKGGAWVAQWTNFSGKRCFKRCSISKNIDAFELACFIRQEAISLLKTQGLSYNSRGDYASR